MRVSNVLVPIGVVVASVASGGHASVGEEESTVSDAPAQVRMVRDIRPGASDAGIAELTPMGEWLYFTADDGVHGREVWRSDGLVAELVVDIRTGHLSSNPRSLIVSGDWLYFVASPSVNQDVLWRTNGTSTEMVAAPPVYSVPRMNNAELPYEYDGWLYVRATDPDHLQGEELWRTNGTVFELVADINQGSGSSSPHHFVELDGWLYFGAYESATGWEIWRTNSVLTERVTDVNHSGAYPSSVGHVVVGGWLYFVADDGVTGEELWRTNGADVELVADTYPGATGSSIQEIGVIDETLYYFAVGYGADYGGLWRTEGSGTERVYDAWGGALVDLAGWLYFASYDDGGLWRTDGSTLEKLTDDTTVEVDYRLTVIDGWLYFGTKDVNDDFHVWRTNGSRSERIEGISPASAPIPRDVLVASLGDHTFFVATDGRTGLELWSTVPAPSFSDVSTLSPFYAEIAWLAVSGVTEGYPDGSFRPSAHVSRQAMAAFLYRAAGEPVFEVPVTATFVDVPTTHPFFTEIEWLNNFGITTGYPDGSFRPSAVVSRQAMAAFLYRAAGERDLFPPEESQFPDVGVGHPFLAEIEWLVSTGVTTGYNDGTYRPTANVTRQAMAAFLYRYLYVHLGA